MKIAGGLIDLVLALIFFALTGLTVTGIPGALERSTQEPEDLLILFVLLPLLVLVGVVTLLAGVILLRGKALTWIPTRRVAAAVLTGSLLLLLLALIGLVANEPSSAELRFLFIPALALGWSYFLIQVHVAHKHEAAAQ